MLLLLPSCAPFLPFLPADTLQPFLFSPLPVLDSPPPFPQRALSPGRVTQRQLSASPHPSAQPRHQQPGARPLRAQALGRARGAPSPSRAPSPSPSPCFPPGLPGPPPVPFASAPHPPRAPRALPAAAPGPARGGRGSRRPLARRAPRPREIWRPPRPLPFPARVMFSL